MGTVALAEESGDQAGAMRELARLALSDEWSIAAGMATGEDALEAATLYAESLTPICDVDPRLTGPAARKARDWLKPIGMKISPTMSLEQCSDWLNAEMLALSDFPARVIMQAARNAIRIPMQFLNQVDGHVRAEAEKIMVRHRRALFRLERLCEAIAKAGEPALQAPEGYEGGNVPPMSIEELKASIGSPVGAAIIRMGLSAGYIDPADYEAALAQIANETTAIEQGERSAA